MTLTGHDLSDPAVWAETPLGDPAGWPASLTTAAQLCLDHPAPCCLLWGERSHFFYNEQMAASIGPRHPAAMGQPLYDVLPHLWATVGPLLHEVVRTGRAFAADRFPLQADVGAGVTMFYVDLTLVPVRDAGRVVGVLSPVHHRTAIHLEQQRRDVLAAIARLPPGLGRTDVAAAITRHVVTLDDVRFAVLFLPDAGTGRPVRVATSGAVLRTGATRAALDLAVERGQWPVAAVLASDGPPVLTAPVVRSGAGPARPSWRSAWLAPLPAGSGARGVLALGFDERFESSEVVPPLVEALTAATAERLAR